MPGGGAYHKTDGYNYHTVQQGAGLAAKEMDSQRITDMTNRIQYV